MKLSKLIKKVNKENAPPDGWKASEVVKNMPEKNTVIMKTISKPLIDKKIQLTQNEIDNLLDVLDEWYHCDMLGVKELEENEIGLNDDRYKALIKKLKKG